MSIASIEARVVELLGMHKTDLARALSKAEHLLAGFGHDIESIYADAPAEAAAETLAVSTASDPEPAFAPGTDPEVTEVAPVSTEPELLEQQPAVDPAAQSVAVGELIGDIPAAEPVVEPEVPVPEIQPEAVAAPADAPAATEDAPQ